MRWIIWLLLLLGPSFGAAPAEPIEITVLSYNIKRGLGNDGQTDLGRAAGLIRRLDPDLVALQEIDNGVDRSGRTDQIAVL